MGSIPQAKQSIARGVVNQNLTYDIFVDSVKNNTKLLTPNTILLVDACLAVFPAASEFRLPQGGFICELIWGSIGYTMGGATGAKCGSPKSRIVVLVGDGGFQNLPAGLSTMARLGQNNIIFVFDNGVYSIDQFLIVIGQGLKPNEDCYLDPKAKFEGCNYLPRWDFVQLAHAFGGKGWKVDNIFQLNEAIDQAIANQKTFSLISVTIPERDLPEQLKGLLPK